MDNKRIGGFISAQRKQMSMTQQDLAQKLNITNKAVSKWETGEGYPDISVLPALAQILNVTVDEILKGEKDDSRRQSGSACRIKETKQQAEYLLENSMRHFSIQYPICLGIVLFGIISTSLSLRLYNGIPTSLIYALAISLSFLFIGAMFYYNTCNYLKRAINKYTSMDDTKQYYRRFIYKRHILFYALYSIQITILIGVIPLYPIISLGYYSVFHKLFGYNSNGFFVIDISFFLMICFVIYCILFITGTLFIKKKFGK